MAFLDFIKNLGKKKEGNLELSMPPVPEGLSKETGQEFQESNFGSISEELGQLPEFEIPEELEISTKQYKGARETGLQALQDKGAQKEMQPLSRLTLPLEPSAEQLSFEKQYLAERDIDINEPLFIKAKNYGEALEKISEAKKITKIADDMALGLNQIHHTKEAVLDKWRIRIEEIQRKLIMVDRKLFER